MIYFKPTTWAGIIAGADEGTRTPDQLITNQLLYQLSYIGPSFKKARLK